MNDIKVIMLGQDGDKGFTIVDPDMFDVLNQYVWTPARKNGYAIRGCASGIKSIREFVYMHHCVVGKPLKGEVDHINRCAFDNTRRNLRFATHAQNIRNSIWKKKEPTANNYVGVRRHKQCKSPRWTAEIMVNYKRKYLGLFKSEEKAARARDAAAIKYHGEFANLNFTKGT